MEWAAGISALLGIVLLVLKGYYARDPARKEEQRNEEIQQGRADIAAGNADAVSVRIDSLCSKDPGDTDRLGSDEDTKRRLMRFTGVSGVGDE
jgi:hypothetical protein